MPEFKTVVESLQYWSRRLGDAPAFIFRHSRHGRHVLTWNKLYTLSGRFAAILRERAVSRGHLVVNTLTNSPERVVSELAILMSGAASVNGQCLLADGSDLLRTLRVSRAAAILVDPDVPDSPWNVLKLHVTVGDDDTLTSESLPDLKKIFFVRRVDDKGHGDFICHLETLTASFQADDIIPDDTVTILTTSGTTGFSKLVVESHVGLTGSGQCPEVTVSSFYQPGQKVFSMAPLGWAGGYVGTTILAGAVRVLCDIRSGGIPADTPEFIWRSLAEEECQVLFTPPAYLPRIVAIARQYGLRDGPKTISNQNLGDVPYSTSPSASKPTNGKETQGEEVSSGQQSQEALAKDGSQGDVPISTSPSPLKLTKLLLGGQPVTRSMVKIALGLTNPVTVAYAGTEPSIVSALDVQDWTDYVDHDTGPPLTNVQVKIVSQQDEDIQLPADQLGLILVKKSHKRSYLNDPEASAAMFTSDGFIRTGDVGRLDQRGHLIVEGRGSDAIMRGHYIFYPAWLERRVCACPGVRGVCIVGVPNPDVNEELCACVVLESDDVTMKEVREFVERDIAVKEDDLLSPRPRYYLRFESFPVTSTNKPSRKMIKEQAAQMLGL
ncbi:hypothetical protein V1264_019618 [Littorina saxatilis]|uniref:Uncharacterized protein n=2 Tax=Littorina saxatilis TaxID=31220 RepID=A0AAN9GE41_9CAEN